jgi:hypothetical protein
MERGIHYGRIWKVGQPVRLYNNSWNFILSFSNICQHMPVMFLIEQQFRTLHEHLNEFSCAFGMGLSKYSLESG